MNMNLLRFFFRAVLVMACSAPLAQGWLPTTTRPSRHCPCRANSVACQSSTVADDDKWDEQVDVAVIGAGLGGLCAGSILNTLYQRKVAVYERHYLAGGCAHAFERRNQNGTFTFDAGPTILLGCSRAKNPNAIEQVLRAINQTVDWMPYDGWGMVEYPQTEQLLRWKVPLGPGNIDGDNVSSLIQGPMRRFGGDLAVREYEELRMLTRRLCAGVEIPAMAMRSGPTAIIPLLFRHALTLWEIIQQGSTVTGTFAPYIDGPEFEVKSPWLRAWLDALAFSLSGLPANRTAAAAMAFTIQDMHAVDATLDYPVGGMGSIVDALIRGVEQGHHGSAVHLQSDVVRIEFDESGKTALGVCLKNGKRVRATQGVVSNVPVWSLRSLVEHHKGALEALCGTELDSIMTLSPPPKSWTLTSDGSVRIRYDRRGRMGADIKKVPTLQACDSAEQTGSFLHLHVALNATGLDLEQLEAHYTVMDEGLLGSDPCAELNMIAVSNPCRLDGSLSPPGTIVIHAYAAGNEPYQIWRGMDRKSDEYKKLKECRAQVLWRAIESIIPDARERVLMDLTGSPLTHERYLNRPSGTYGSATEDYLPDGSTPIKNLVLAGDGIFPGIGVPAVAINGASAANSLVR